MSLNFSGLMCRACSREFAMASFLSKVFAVLALLLCGVSHALTVPCWPQTPATVITGQVPGESGVFYAAWMCQGNQAFFFTFTASEALQWLNQPLLDANAATAAAANVPALSAAHQAVFRTVMVNQGWKPPKALTSVAYKQRQAVDGLTYVAIGSVPIDTPCTMQGQAGDYMPVPRASVTLASRFDTLPLVAYARCG